MNDIVKLQINGIDAGSFSPGNYGVCSTAGNVAAKAVTITNFVLNTKCMVSVLFTNAFTVSNPTLNVSNTGAHAIKIYGSAIPMYSVDNNTILNMIYDGEFFNVVSIQSKAPSTPGAVDLGLPSGLLWCDHNVGASKPEEEGLFFSWGNVEGHNLNGTGDYNFGTSNTTEPYVSSSGATIQYPGSIAVGDAYDMARANMGVPWRLPTNTEFQELYDNCTNAWVTQNGMTGRRFTSNVNGNSIFFPAAGHYYGSSHYNEGSNGYYWSSVLLSADYAYILRFYSTGVHPQNYDYRYLGFSVRAVQ